MEGCLWGVIWLTVVGDYSGFSIACGASVLGVHAW